MCRRCVDQGAGRSRRAGASSPGARAWSSKDHAQADQRDPRPAGCQSGGALKALQAVVEAGVAERLGWRGFASERDRRKADPERLAGFLCDRIGPFTAAVGTVEGGYAHPGQAASDVSNVE